MSREGTAGLAGLRILAFESRRAVELAELIRRHGGTPISAPSMREVPLERSAEADELLRRLQDGSLDVLILLTGVGTRALVAALVPSCPRERFAELLGRVTLVARGPKPVAALRELGLTADLLVPEPNTWRELLATLDARMPVRGRRVAVQEYGRPNPELIDGLHERGADVLRVPVYRWEYPEDQGPLREGIVRMAEAGTDIAVFTSARQVDHVVETATRLDRLAALMAAARTTVIASIGPVCSEALAAHGFPVDLEPEHPKMGHLVAALAQRGLELVERKRQHGISTSA